MPFIFIMSFTTGSCILHFLIILDTFQLLQRASTATATSTDADHTTDHGDYKDDDYHSDGDCTHHFKRHDVYIAHMRDIPDRDYHLRHLHLHLYRKFKGQNGTPFFRRINPLNSPAEAEK